VTNSGAVGSTQGGITLFEYRSTAANATFTNNGGGSSVGAALTLSSGQPPGRQHSRTMVPAP
jgi:hypothetical protein